MEYNDYEPTGLAADIFQKRYAIVDKETFASAVERVAYHVAQAEHGDDIAKFRDEFAWMLRKNLFFPGGRIMYGSGRPKGQMLNCFVIPTSDSREGWGRSTSDMIVIAGSGGGVGMNGSPIRPRGAPIASSGGQATGAVSLFHILNAAGDVIKAGGGRRVALMLALEHDHGDILEFMDEKLNLDKLNNANVSVVFQKNPEVFFEKVRKNEEYELRHNGKVVGKLMARDVWNKIIGNALKNGEPGVLNGYYANKMSNIGYHTPLVCTNPCGEIWLSSYESCCLGSIVLPRFVDENRGDVDWDALKKVVGLGVRFLDDVLTVNNYPLVEIKEQCSNLRRIGLGITGLHDMLIKMGYAYNEPDGLEFVDKVMDKIKSWAYEASAQLAIEKGSFPKFDPDMFLKGGFAKNLRHSIKEKIRKYGIRNCALLTVAPVGTGSMVCDCSSGIEPMFAPAYERRWRDGDELKKEIVIHPLFKRFMDEGRPVEQFQSAYELSPRDHFEMQRTVQRHIDNAVSKTINIPQGVNFEELSNLYMEFFTDLKGVTVYPQGSRENQPLTPMDLKSAIAAYNDNVTTSGQVESKCKTGLCDI